MATNDPLLNNLTATGYLNYTPPVAIGGPGAGPIPYDGPTGGGYTAPSYDPAQVALYDQSINNLNAANSNLDTQYNSGVGSLNAQTQDALNVLLGGRNQANQSYNENKQGVATGYVGQKNTIGENAGGTLSGLLRLLGSRGAGGSALAKFLPGEVARLASNQRSDVSNTFAGNNRSLDQGWGQYDLNYGNEVNRVNTQKERGLQTLAQNKDSSRASILQQLAQIAAAKADYMGGNAAASAQPYYDQANNLLAQISNYATPSISYNTQAYQAPSLASYNQNPAITGNVGGQTSSALPDWIAPSLAGLLKKQTAGA